MPVQPQTGPSGLALVSVVRPADVPAALGCWGSPITAPPDQRSRRCWAAGSKRFGAVLVGLGTHQLRLSVAYPPRDTHTASLLACEHYALCPQGVEAVDHTLRGYADFLLDQREWLFEWH